MFATIEEAEKAARMLRRFGGKDSYLIHPHNYAHAVGLGDGTTVCDWEGLADYLLAREIEPPQDRLHEVRACVVTAGMEYRAGHNGPALKQLIRAFDALLEALA